MDRLSPQKRSWLMSRVSSKNTKPEIAVRSLLHKLGYRFRLHASDLPGKPDIVFRKRKKVIFIHGCFWHGHLDCKYAKPPSTRADFWREKIYANRARDKRTLIQLEESGWEVLTIWECELKDTTALVVQLELFLGLRKNTDFLKTEIDI